jgi:hypothetical protein
MSRLSATSTIAGVWSRGDRTAVVVVRGGATPALVASETFSQGADLRGFLRRHKAERVVRVAPAERTLVHAASLDSASGHELGPADLARSFAAASLPGSVPEHRRAAAALGGKAAAVAWVGVDAPRPIFEDSREVWTTPEACALALAGGSAQRIALADRASGVVSAVDLSANPPRARSLREVAEDQEAWDSLVRGFVEGVCGEGTARSAHRIELEEMTLLGVQPEAVARRVQGVSGDPAWWRRHAMALGACLCALDQGGLCDLAVLYAGEPVPPRAAHRRVVDWLAVGNRAAVVSTAATLLAVAAWAGLSWAGLSLAASKSPAASANRSRETQRLLDLAGLYNAMGERRLPMSKLLADISAAAPVEVTVERLRMSAEQGVSIAGTSVSTDGAALFERRLQDTKLFASVRVTNTSAREEGGVRFDISAKPGEVFAPVKPVEDFVSQPLAVRLHGAGASNTAPPEGAVLTRTVRKPGAGGVPGASGGGEGGRRSAAAQPKVGDDAPPPVSDEDIKKMNMIEAMKGWSSRSSYVSKNPNLDGTTRQRLKDEEAKMRARHEELKLERAKTSGGGS